MPRPSNRAPLPALHYNVCVALAGYILYAALASAGCAAGADVSSNLGGGGPESARSLSSTQARAGALGSESGEGGASSRGGAASGEGGAQADSWTWARPVSTSRSGGARSTLTGIPSGGAPTSTRASTNTAAGGAGGSLGNTARPTAGSGSLPSSASATGSLSAAPVDPNPGNDCKDDHVLISQIRSRGAGGATDEFVELFNPTDADVDLTGWYLEVANGAHATPSPSKHWTGAGIVPAGSHYLIVGTGYSGSPGGAPPGDETSLRSITDSASVVLYDEASNPIDRLCFGFDAATLANLASAGFDCPGPPANNTPHNDVSSPSSNVDTSLGRREGAGGATCADTGSSAADFEVRSPALPRNSSG